MLTPTSRPPFSYHFLRISLGFVYFHFGILKFFPDLSPAELLASQTIMRLTGGILDASDALFILAIMEVGLGFCLIFNVFMRFAFVLFIFHMIGTFTPIIVLPELAFKIFPFAPTIEGQYILKNVVFVAAGWGLLAPYVFARQTANEQAADEMTSNQSATADTPAQIIRPAIIHQRCQPAIANFTQDSK